MKDRLSNADIHFWKDKLDAKNQEFVEFVMAQYEKNGFESLNDLMNLINLKYGNSSVVEDMGGVSTVKGNFETLQKFCTMRIKFAKICLKSMRQF